MRILLLIPATILLGCGKGTPLAEGPQKPKPEPVVEGKLNRVFPLEELKTVNLDVNGHEVKAWIMDNDAKITEGMMWLKPSDVKDSEGMIFVFPDALPRKFWMKNCPLGLDIIFLGETGKVDSIQVGKPQDETPLPSKGPVKYALELKVGMAKRYGVKAGQTVSIPSFVQPE